MIFVRNYTTRTFNSPVLSSILEPFRKAMARVSQQAMILTSASQISKSEKELHGMTLGSVCSLAVYPNPLLQFNLHLPSYTSAELHRNEYLAIHLLPPTSRSVRLSRIFAKGVKKDKSGKVLDTTKEELKDGRVFHEMTTPFANLKLGQDYHLHNINQDLQIPVLNDVEEIFICKTRNNFPVDHHEIWVVNVIDILTNKTYVNDYTDKSGGILYFNRGFHKLGDTLREN